MNNSRFISSNKATLIALLGGTIGGVVFFPYLTKAIEIKTDLDHKVQHIEQMVFSTWGMKGDDGKIPPAAIISAKNYNPVISGNLFVEHRGNNNTLDKKAEHSALFYGTDNSLSGNDSITVVGDHNKVSNNTTGIVILWGKINTIKTNSQYSVIAGWQQGTVQGNFNFIGVWGDNTIIGNWNTTIGGRNTTVKWANNFIAGSYINFDPQSRGQSYNNTFVWSDNVRRLGAKRDFTPAKDGTFLIRAEKGLAIGVPTTSIPGSVEVNGMVQLGNDTEACTQAKVWAIKYIDEKPSGCFCACDNGAGIWKWSALSPSPYCESKCRG